MAQTNQSKREREREPQHKVPESRPKPPGIWPKKASIGGRLYKSPVDSAFRFKFDHGATGTHILPYWRPWTWYGLPTTWEPHSVLTPEKTGMSSDSLCLELAGSGTKPERNKIYHTYN